MVTNQPLVGKIALVTGATRGIGKGIALQLAQAGAVVYITGRTLKSSNGLGSLEDTANEIRNRGGKCIPCQVDHENDVEICMLFKKIEDEQNGRLDILVNNAYKGVTAVFENIGLNFWETKPEIWDEINNVGLRNHYICTVYAARLMVPRKQGLIVNISSVGGMRYLFNVAYGVGKEACDRMAVDCGTELKKHGVTMLSLYPGAVKTELISQLNETPRELQTGPVKLNVRKAFEKGESIEFSGKIIVCMSQDPNIMRLAGRVVIGADYAQQHHILDIDNRMILSIRQVKTIADYFLPESMKFVAQYIPGFLRVPQWIFDVVNSKF